MKTGMIGFLAPENVCLALKIKALIRLEAEIIGNICFMAAILENAAIYFLPGLTYKCVSLDS